MPGTWVGLRAWGKGGETRWMTDKVFLETALRDLGWLQLIGPNTSVQTLVALQLPSQIFANAWFKFLGFQIEPILSQTFFFPEAMDAAPCWLYPPYWHYKVINSWPWPPSLQEICGFCQDSLPKNAPLCTEYPTDMLSHLVQWQQASVQPIRTCSLS